MLIECVMNFNLFWEWEAWVFDICTYIHIHVYEVYVNLCEHDHPCINLCIYVISYKLCI